MTATLICSNPKCDNISSKLYIVENKIIESIKYWLKNYKINFENLKNSLDIDNNNLITQSILSTKKTLEIENNKLYKLYDFLENGIYNKDEFITRSKVIKKNIQILENKLKKYQEVFIQEKELQIQNEFEIPKLENIIDLYYKIPFIKDKNILLKSILFKVTYLKTEKAIKKDSDPNSFELHIYPKIPKI